MLSLICSSNDPVWTDFANFCKFLANFPLFFNRQALGYFGLVFRYHFCWKLEENMATRVISVFYQTLDLVSASLVIDIPQLQIEFGNLPDDLQYFWDNFITNWFGKISELFGETA